MSGRFGRLALDAGPGYPGYRVSASSKGWQRTALDPEEERIRAEMKPKSVTAKRPSRKKDEKMYTLRADYTLRGTPHPKKGGVGPRSVIHEFRVPKDKAEALARAWNKENEQAVDPVKYTVVPAPARAA